jgi:hypothetical protein
VKTKQDSSLTGKTVETLMTAVNMGKGQLTDEMVANRTRGGGNTGSLSGERIIGDIVASGACERHPNLRFNLIGFRRELQRLRSCVRGAGAPADGSGTSPVGRRTTAVQAGELLLLALFLVLLGLLALLRHVPHPASGPRWSTKC